MCTVASNSQTGPIFVFSSSINPNYWCTKIRCNETLLSGCQMLHNITVRYLNSLLTLSKFKPPISCKNQSTLLLYN